MTRQHVSIPKIYSRKPGTRTAYVVQQYSTSITCQYCFYCGSFSIHVINVSNYSSIYCHKKKKNTLSLAFPIAVSSSSVSCGAGRPFIAMDRADDASLLLVPLVVVVVAIGAACLVLIRTESSITLHDREGAIPGALTKSTKALVEKRGA